MPGGSGACPGDHTNFSNKDKEKPQTRIEVEKIPQVRDLIMQEMEKDYKFWNDKGLKQFGVETLNLLKKISQKIKINSNVYYLALEDLEFEQKILPMQDGNFTRYILLKMDL